jgi:hypothetical protein
MPRDPQRRTSDDSTPPVGPENGPDHTTTQEVAEPGRKRNDADTEWLSMATADPAHFLKDLHSE